MAVEPIESKIQFWIKRWISKVVDGKEEHALQ